MPILEALLSTPVIQLDIQNWVWDRKVDVPRSVVLYAQDRHGQWAVPRLQEAIEHKVRMDAEAAGGAGTGAGPDGMLVVVQNSLCLPSLPCVPWQ